MVDTNKEVIRRDCDYLPCKESCYPCGDGSTPHLNTETGGKYFCCEAHKNKYIESQEQAA